MPQSREKLASLLWGSSNDERARHNLRQALSRIRQALGPHAIVNEAEAITLAPGLLDCDAVSLDRLIRVNSEGSIAEAAELYGGLLLADVIVNEDAWNDWLVGERERLSESAIGAMVQQGRRELAAGRAEAALRLGWRATSFNKFREDAHRLVLMSLAATGRTSEAKKRYQDLAAYLKAELDTEPDEETRQLVLDVGSKEGRGVVNDPEGSANLVPSRSAAPAPTSPPPRKDTAATDSPTVVASEAMPGPEAPDLAVSRRRQLSILVCDLVGATQNSQAVDPEDMGGLAASFRRLAADVAVRSRRLCCADFG